VDFLKLVQKKEQIADNKIIIATVILVVLIMSAIVFWPGASQHKLLTYLPEGASFYWHWTSKNYFSQDFLAQTEVDSRMDELKNILGSNFLNLQEVLWFQVDNNSANDNYLLRFSRLPRSYVRDLEDRRLDFRVYSPAKNILLINKGKSIDNLIANPDKTDYFDAGMSIYWQKNQAPDFLQELAGTLEPLFSTNDVLINWQKVSLQRNKLVLLEERAVGVKDFKNFFTPADFELAFGFGSQMSDDLAGKISNDLLKPFFDSLPYYHLSKTAIKERILKDTIVWQKGDGWLLASHQPFRENILDFIHNLKVEEVARVLSDGTAYTELVAAKDQTIIEQQINGQKILQIDQIFLWDIGEQHYLTNRREMIENLSSDNHYLVNILQDCVSMDAQIGDFIYLATANLPTGQIKDYLLDNQVSKLEMFSFATGTISGLNICF